MVIVIYNDKLVYNVVIWVFWGLYYEKRRKLKQGHSRYLHLNQPYGFWNCSIIFWPNCYYSAGISPLMTQPPFELFQIWHSCWCILNKLLFLWRSHPCLYIIFVLEPTPPPPNFHSCLHDSRIKFCCCCWHNLICLWNNLICLWQPDLFMT